jgi:transposase
MAANGRFCCAVREITAVLDLSWVHSELASYYSQLGRPSIDPVLMIRMLIVGYVFAIRSSGRYAVMCK